MTVSLRDKLLGLGFQPPAKPEKPAKPANKPQARSPDRPATAARGKPGQAHRPGNKPASPKSRSSEEMDLAKAYAIRAQREKQERIEAEQRKQDEARRKREAKASIVALLKDHVLNDAAAEIARHFEYGGKIRRIYVTAEQLKALNAGELAVVQLDGRYLLVNVATAMEVAALLPSLLALRVDPNAPAVDDPYADPQYQVPDDLVW